MDHIYRCLTCTVYPFLGYYWNPKNPHQSIVDAIEDCLENLKLNGYITAWNYDIKSMDDSYTYGVAVASWVTADGELGIYTTKWKEN